MVKSEVLKPFSILNPNKKSDTRVTGLENDVKAMKDDVKAIKQSIEETKNQFSLAFEMLHDQIEKLCSKNYEVDNQDVDQVAIYDCIK